MRRIAGHGIGWEIAKALCFLLPLATMASAQTAVVSGASYQPTVAPGSFASLFGNGLAPSIAVGTQGSDGSYPKQLNGLTVTVGGAAADLVMVSPSQINFVVPLTAPYGTVNVSVADGLQTIAAGTASVSPTAPAVFTTNASGTGFGAILDGVDFSAPPFTLGTAAGGGHVTTIAAVFGTGFRYAGGASPASPPADVSGHVTAIASDPQGHSWQLPVLYAGPAPGYEGLDQINIQFVDSINTEADLTLTLYTDTVPSNPVYLLLRSKTSLAFSAVAPANGSPGSSITLTAAGLLGTTRYMVSTRQYAVFTLPDGTQYLSDVRNVTGSTGDVLIPIMPASTPGSYYTGPAQVCIFVDSQTSCLPFTIAAPPQTGQAVGALLLASTSTAITTAINSLPSTTDPALKALITSTAQARLSTLQQQIADALAGHPDSVRLSDLDGDPITVVLDISMIQRVEALLAGAPSTPAGSAVSQRIATTRDATQNCNTSQESALALRKSAYDSGQQGIDIFANKIRSVADNITQACFNALTKVGATGWGSECMSLGAGASYVEGLVDIPFQVGQYTNMIVQIVQAWEDPIFLQSITPSIDSAALSYTLPTRSFDVVGNLVSKSKGKLIGDVIGDFVNDEITSKIVDDGRTWAAVGGLGGNCGVVGCSAYYDYLNTVANTFQSLVVDKLLGLIPGYNSNGPQTSNAWLGVYSLTAASTMPSITVALACTDGDRSSVTLTQSPVNTEGTVTIMVNPDKLLVLDPSSPPQSSIAISVNNAAPTLNTDKISYRLQDTMQVQGFNFPSGMHLSLSLQGIRTLTTLIPNLVVAGDGTIRQPVPLAGAATPGIYTLVAASMSGQALASSGTLTIATTPVAHFTMTAGANSATDGGLLTAAVAPNANVQVRFDATGSSTTTGTSIVKWVWQSNGGTLNCSSATCTLPFSTPSNTITLTVTDGNGQVAQATGQLNLTTVQSAGGFALSTDKSAVPVIQGQSATLNVTVRPSGGFQSRVRLATGALPPGVTVSWNPAAVTPSGGGSVSSSLAITTAVSTPAGPYTVTISGTADGYAQQTVSVTLTVGAALPGPTAHFKVTALGQTAQDGQTLTLQPTSAAPVQVQLDGSASVSPGGNITSWLWASSGVPLACTTSTCTAYFATATNAVTLTITDTNGKLSTATVQVNLAFPGAPTAHFSMSGGGQSGTDGQTLSYTVPVNGSVSMTFTSTSAQGSAAITSYVWKSNGTPICGNSSTCTAPFGTPSNTITLTVTDSNSNTSTATGQVNITHPTGPTAHFSMSGGGQSGSDGQTLTYSLPVNGSVSMTFTSTSTQGSAAITTYAWKSNGTGICNNSSTCTFPFGTPSNTITLTVTDSNSLTSTATGQVNITH